MNIFCKWGPFVYTIIISVHVKVRTLVNELCRITVLWDEFWLGSLAQLSNTVSERTKALSSEVSPILSHTYYFSVNVSHNVLINKPSNRFSFSMA